MFVYILSLSPWLLDFILVSNIELGYFTILASFMFVMFYAFHFITRVDPCSQNIMY